jgi:hypothetical protein
MKELLKGHMNAEKSVVAIDDIEMSEEKCCNCCFVMTCCGHQYKSRLTRRQTLILVLTLVFAVILVIIFLIFAIVPVNYVPRTIQPLTTAVPSAIPNDNTRVLLYGDSQWGVTESRKMFLIARIKEYLPEYPLDINTYGISFFKPDHFSSCAVISLYPIISVSFLIW